MIVLVSQWMYSLQSKSFAKEKWDLVFDLKI